MKFDDIHVGMKCDSYKGSGTVIWVDGATQTIYMSNMTDNNSFDVAFEDLIDDPQAHNPKDTYY